MFSFSLTLVIHLILLSTSLAKELQKSLLHVDSKLKRQLWGHILSQVH
jgi:hypothetical protein